jgi:hypothetical protein
VEKSNQRHGLLRQRVKLPSDYRTAESGHKLPSSNAECH